MRYRRAPIRSLDADPGAEGEATPVVPLAHLGHSLGRDEPAAREEPQHTICILGAPSRAYPGPGFRTARCMAAMSAGHSSRAS